ncbi:MAG: CD1871A family CXXC motif-containing protein [Clostridia bacterium]
MTDKRKNFIAGAILIAGLLFILLGIFRGEIQTVLRKAVNICLECIGIG